ncbi:MAG TPA: hypothetical protein VGX49_00140 [Jatrophihabitans sp.]|nr:hypothetical protein [Jatrophihabitans sp.]
MLSRRPAERDLLGHRPAVPGPVLRRRLLETTPLLRRLLVESGPVLRRRLLERYPVLRGPAGCRGGQRARDGDRGRRLLTGSCGPGIPGMPGAGRNRLGRHHGSG